MADHYAYYNQNQTQRRQNNKVYINPNFNRVDNPSINISSNNMYFNPKFSHNTQINTTQLHVQEPKVQKSNARIHVNPNFLRNANIAKAVNNPIKSLNLPPPLINTYSTEINQEQSTIPLQTPSAHITKSRYCIVRQKENAITNSPASKLLKKTVKVNKYKSISLHVAKSNLSTQRLASTSNTTSLCNEKYQNLQQKADLNKNSRFKFVKPNTMAVLNNSLKKHAGIKRYSILNKSLPKTPTRKISIRLALKKNNIPCPLFKKYGNCLRKLRGTCEYLHDKKHVTICRKFLKGICHDKDCLLSHDLTDKKMPTCYFYLQGACTKDRCPYLHIKLSDKTKICPDFRSGYCEKGEKCLFRHVNNCKDMTSKKVCIKKQFTLLPENKIHANKVKSRKKSQAIPSYGSMLDDHHKEAHRYFKESVEDNNVVENCDMIKPSRIKLGTLPGFIQL